MARRKVKSYRRKDGTRVKGHRRHAKTLREKSRQRQSRLVSLRAHLIATRHLRRDGLSVREYDIRSRYFGDD